MAYQSLSHMQPEIPSSSGSSFIEQLLQKMTLAEKIAQMCQQDGSGDFLGDQLRQGIKGGVGSVINQTDPDINKELQRVARDESRLGIPLLIGRDVIHGFNTIFPIPLGVAASWNPEIARKMARISAEEAAQVGVNWTFSPMVDISRDPRWGRIAEGFGEDPLLCSHFAHAMVEGYQSGSFSQHAGIASCAKHFVGYGASESGRDYNTTDIPEVELHNVHLPPFQQAVKAGVASLMTSFSDLNGMPPSGNQWLLRGLLKGHWNYQGFVVSDWGSVIQLIDHGVAENQLDAAYLAAKAGVDMEMVSPCYESQLQTLVESLQLDEAVLDDAVRRILHVKFDLGLFDNSLPPEHLPAPMSAANLVAAREAAVESCVLLKNNKAILPLSYAGTKSIGVIGPLADDGYEQLGTWIFDGSEEGSSTCLQALQDVLPEGVQVNYCKAMHNSRSQQADFETAKSVAEKSDIVVMVVGEESILSGEAHCRTNISLPGCQEALIKAVAETGTAIVLVIMAGRPLTIEPIINSVDAILYAWHPGTMGGPAIVDLLLGHEIPRGKLPVCFPRTVGQIPLYYAQKPGGKPVTAENFVHMDSFPDRAPQTSMGMSAAHMDTYFTPLYNFGYGLSYSEFEYSNLHVSALEPEKTNAVKVSFTLTNTGDREAFETAQLYTRDLVACQTRPVRELKHFKRVHLKAGESVQVEFQITHSDQSFFTRHGELVFEPGCFRCWVGGSADASLSADFEFH